MARAYVGTETRAVMDACGRFEPSGGREGLEYYAAEVDAAVATAALASSPSWVVPAWGVGETTMLVLLEGLASVAVAVTREDYERAVAAVTPAAVDIAWTFVPVASGRKGKKRPTGPSPWRGEPPTSRELFEMFAAASAASA